MGKHRTICISAALVAAALGFGTASGQDMAPRPMSSDERNQFHFEQAEKELDRVVAAALANIDRLKERTGPEDARASLADAHRQWLTFRDSDCRADASFLLGISARTKKSLTAACRLRTTKERIETLRARYLLDAK